MNLKYDQKYCDELISHMEKGKSFESFAGTIRVNRATIFRWKKNYEEFREAYEVGFCLSLNKWEDIGLAGLYMGGKDNPFNSTVWVFNMKNRFGWTDKKEVKADEGTVKALLGYGLKPKDE